MGSGWLSSLQGCRSSLSMRDKGSNSAISPAQTSSAVDQPKTSSKPKVPGSMTNCPNEPAALAMPMAMLRFSGATERPTADSNTENEVPDKPKPISTPALRNNVEGVLAEAINSKPKA